MAGGFGGPKGGTEFEAKITPLVAISCLLSASGGLMFGYDVGISGGVTSMPDFLKKFFPSVYRNQQVCVPGLTGNYCKYDNQGLQLFTSSLYLAAIVATFLASYITKRFGRKTSMLIAGILFLAGTVLNAAAVNLAMLMIGRLLLGCGVGFANHAIPLFLSEIAPTRTRGALNILFQLCITIGIYVANLINFGTAKLANGYGWRISLGLAAVPALVLTIGSLFVTDSPNSLIARGKLEEGKAVLKRIRGVDNVELEYAKIVDASRAVVQVKNPFRNLLKRRNRPALVIGILMQIFQQFTGINAIMFYAPVLFQTLGFKSDAALASSAIIGTVNLVSTLVAVLFVDRAGRRMLLIEAGFQMFLSQMGVAILMGLKDQDHSNNLGHGLGFLVVALVCIFVSSFAWSWGPLGWLIPSETFAVEARSAGQSMVVSTNMLFTFMISQAFLSMLCQMKFGIFYFFSASVVLMTLFTIFFIPETKNIPIDEMNNRVWKQHWYWRRFMDDLQGEPTGEDQKKSI